MFFSTKFVSIRLSIAFLIVTKGVLMKGNHVQVVIGPEVTTVRTELDKMI